MPPGAVASDSAAPAVKVHAPKPVPEQPPGAAQVVFASMAVPEGIALGAGQVVLPLVMRRLKVSGDITVRLWLEAMAGVFEKTGVPTAGNVPSVSHGVPKVPSHGQSGEQP